MNWSTVRKTLLIGSILTWTLVVVSVVVNILWVPNFAQVGHLAYGCYQTDALLSYVECKGFALAPITSTFLTLPYLLPFGPVLILFNPILGIPLWFFLLYLVWYVWDKWRHTQA
jgi:hypothetical protein